MPNQSPDWTDPKDVDRFHNENASRAEALPPDPVRVATALWRYVNNTNPPKRVDALIAKRWPDGLNAINRNRWIGELGSNNPCPFGSMDSQTIAAYVACAIEWASEHDS